jgi:hypothetical protein
MIDEKYIELINAEIDGELAAEQRPELSRYLLEHPEARVLRDDLRRLCGALDDVAPVPPPADLGPAILGALPAHAPASRRAAWWAAPALRYAAAFGGGLIVSAIAFQSGVDGRSGPDASELAGTMAGPQVAGPRGAAGRVEVNLQQVSGRVDLYRRAGGLVLEFDLAVRQPVEIVAANGGREVRLSGLGAAGRTGGQRYAVVLPDAGTAGEAVDLRFYAGGALIHEAQLRAAVTG